jgi:hypothetical protein
VVDGCLRVSNPIGLFLLPIWASRKLIFHPCYLAIWQAICLALLLEPCLSFLLTVAFPYANCGGGCDSDRRA